MALMETQRHGAPQGCQVPRQWCAQPNLAPSPLPGTLQHPAALLESQAGCDNAVERGKKKLRALFYFFFTPSPSSVIPSGMCLQIPRCLAACCCRLCL